MIGWGLVLGLFAPSVVSVAVTRGPVDRIQVRSLGRESPAVSCSCTISVFDQECHLRTATRVAETSNP